VEELAYFPKITHVNQLEQIRFSDPVLHLKDETFHNSDIKNSMFFVQTSNVMHKPLVLEPYQMEINIPYMIASLKKTVNHFTVSLFMYYT